MLILIQKTAVPVTGEEMCMKQIPWQKNCITSLSWWASWIAQTSPDHSAMETLCLQKYLKPSGASLLDFFFSNSEHRFIQKMSLKWAKSLVSESHKKSLRNKLENPSLKVHIPLSYKPSAHSRRKLPLWVSYSRITYVQWCSFLIYSCTVVLFH